MAPRREIRGRVTATVNRTASGLPDQVAPTPTKTERQVAEKTRSEMTREELREAEIKKGQEIGARAFLMQTFDPDYIPNKSITPEERRRRDKYAEQVRKNLAAAEESKKW